LLYGITKQLGLSIVISVTTEVRTHLSVKIVPEARYKDVQ